MAKFTPKDRSGKPIKNYKKRHEFIVPGAPNAVRVPGNTSGDLEKALKKKTGILAMNLNITFGFKVHLMTIFHIH